MEKEEQVHRLAYWLAAGLAVLLCGCGATVEKASPAPTPTLTPEVTVMTAPESTPRPEPTVFPTPAPTKEPINVQTCTVDIGDGAHTFWVEITPRESEEEGIPITVSVYDSEEKNTLWQSWEDVCRLYEFEHISVESRDLDFDGDMDLEYSSWLSARMAGWAYWVWDAQQEKFVRDPYGLEELPWPEFDPEKQLVTAWYNESGGTGDFYYRYLDGTLTCIRRLYRDVLSVGEWKVVGIVEDYQNGELEEVYREEFADQGEAWPHTEEFDRWYDLDYHGEGTP